MNGADGLIRRARPWLGTIVEIAVPPPGEAAIDAGFAAIRHVHERMSYHDAGSDLERLRDAALGTLVAVDAETIAVLRTAAIINRDTDGLFDVSVGRHLVDAKFLPPRGDRRLCAITGTAADIEIVDDRYVRLHQPVMIDLGGIAKGHAVDLAVVALISAGCSHGIVNAGGDMRIFGDCPQPIWIRQAGGGLSEPIMVSDSAVATSSNLHSRKRIGRRWVSPHIGRAGAPILGECAVTVIAPTCIIADAMTKVAMADAALADHLLLRYGGHMITPERLQSAA